jgi:hypothetical protein
MDALDMLHQQSTCRVETCLKYTSSQLLEVWKQFNHACYLAQPNSYSHNTHFVSTISCNDVKSNDFLQ